MTASVTSLRTETARVALLRVDETTDELHAEVNVALQWDGEEYEGTSQGPPADSARSGLVAAATLDAINHLADGYELRETATTYAGDSDIALVVISEAGGQRPLVGTAVIDADNRQVAFAKAALDAVNRRLSP
jgi:hypothetical protein